MQYTIKGLLQHNKEFDFDVVAASNGKEAIDKINESGSFDLMLIDWMMPKMDGIELLLNIREMGLTETNIIILTSHCSKENVITAMSAGATGYLIKPISKKTLDTKIEQLFGHKKIPEKKAEPVSEKKAETSSGEIVDASIEDVTETFHEDKKA